jgi:hypothetical protein
MNEEWEIPGYLVKSYIDYLQTHAGDARFFYGNVYLDWYYRLPLEERDMISKSRMKQLAY